MPKLILEVADTPATLAQGLMRRTKLPEERGMLFRFPRVLEASFWGKDTYIPLDVAFINKENKITSIKPITPMSTRPVRSDGDCLMAIEANAGFFDKHKIQPGYKVHFLDKPDKEIEVIFEE